MKLLSLIPVSLVLVATVLAFPSTTYAQLDAATANLAIDSLASVKFKADSIPWRYKAVIGAGFNAVQLSNWTGGGQNAITIRGLFLGELDYRHHIFAWENDVDLGYSITQLGTQSFRKADDRIIYVTKASWRQTDNLRWTAFADLRSQFAVGYNYDVIDTTSPQGFAIVSNFLAPAFLTSSLGAEWTPLPQFKLMAAPIAARAIFVLDDALSNAGAFGVTPGSTVNLAPGAVLNATINWEVVENVTWKSRLNSFMRYENPDLWVVTVENAILMKVNSFISVGFLTDIFYDDRIPVLRDDGTTGPATQIRNQLVIDFRHTFTNH